MTSFQGQFPRKEKPLAAKPRRVRQGVKLPGGELPDGWSAQRWLRALGDASGGPVAADALEYAKNGQTRRMSVEPGVIRALVQGRADKAYSCVIRTNTLDEGQWAQVLSAMADQAIYAAKLLAGEVPESIEDLFAPAGVHLYPTDVERWGLETSCTCHEPQRPWCKHLVCAMYLFAHKLENDPFLVFRLRGMEREELVERLRQQRALAGAGGGSAPVYAPVVPGLSDYTAPSLEECADSFWQAGPELDFVDLHMSPPEVSHPLLRRLGPSPFTEARFPLVGLLATCYEVISEHTLNRSGGEDEPDGDGDEPTDED